MSADDKQDRRRFLKATSIGVAMTLAGCAGDGGGDDGGSGGGDGGDGGSSDVTTLEYWHNQGKNPNWVDEYQEGFDAINPQLQEQGYQIEQNPYAAGDPYFSSIRPVLGTEDGPPLYKWIAGVRLNNIIDDGYAYDVTHIWENYIDEGKYPESLMSSFGQDGKAYSLPATVNYWVVWYNRETFDELGVEPPSSWDGFLQLCDEILNASGGDVAPIAVPLGVSWSGFIWFEELVMRQSLEFYNALCKGERKYTDETSIKTLEMIGNLGESGYIGNVNQAFSTELADLPQMLESDYAMTLIGDWISSSFTANDIDWEKYGWFALPSVNPDVGKQIIVEPSPIAAHAAYPDKDALDLAVDAMMSKEFQEAFDKAQDFVPLHSDIDTSYLPSNLQDLANEVQSGEYGLPLRYWENTDADVAAPASKKFQQAFQGPSKAEQIAQEVEQLRKDVYGSV